jgi:CBS domain-containing protein
MRRVVASQTAPATTKVSEVMTTPVACATPETTSEELRAVMREKRIRHIPVVDGGKVMGMVSIGDLNRTDSDVQEQTILYLEQYMSVP